MQERFDQGWYPGLAPLGYTNVAVAERTGADKDVKIIDRVSMAA
jgi:hypothetical protein